VKFGVSTERRIRLSDGAETTLQQWGERGPMLVAVHGLGASRRGWTRIGEQLAGRYRLVAYDQRGHGDTARSTEMTFARTLEDLGEVVAALGEPVHALLGHSWGGAVVVGGGRRLDVGRVVAIEPMLHAAAGVWSASVLQEYRVFLDGTLAEREAVIRRANASLPEVEIAAKLHAARFITFETIAALGEHNRIDEGGWALRALLDDYPRPLLLALADEKRTVFGAQDRAYARARGGPNVRLEAFTGASHSLQRDAFDRFIPVLEAFLAAAR
jgi:pimeloyl-ACP methyl ester carboxylesterase